MEGSGGALRGLLGARLAGRDNWVVVLGGEKEFVVKHLGVPGLRGELCVGPFQVGEAGEAAGVWLGVACEPKAEGIMMRAAEGKVIEGVLRKYGLKGSIGPGQDIFFLHQSDAALALAQAFLSWIVTGEGSSGGFQQIEVLLVDD